MRPTRMGWGCLLMAALTLLTAASTGNNLLYLLYSALSAALLLSALGGRFNVRRLSASAETPGQTFRGQPTSLSMALLNKGSAASYAVEARWRDCRVFVARVRAGESSQAHLKGVLAHRGLNALTDLALESSFPLGLFRHRRELPSLSALALPRPRQVRDAREVSAEARATGRPTLRKGSGEELFGIRDYAPGDDARILNWKLSARTGRALVNEYCSAHDDKITVTVPATRGEQGERAIEAAAGACRFHIDAGAEVRLETPERAVDYGRGLPQLNRLLRALALLGDGNAPRSNGALPRLRAEPPRECRALRRLTVLGATLTYLGMFLVDEVSARLLLAASPAVALGWIVQERGWTLLPGRVWSALSALVLGYIVLVDWRLSGVTVANVHLLLYLLANRMLNPLRREEFGQVFLILFLAFFLVSGLTISVWYFALFLAYLAFAAAWLMVAAGSPWESRRDWSAGLFGSLVACALLAAGIFTATPRVEGLRRINPFLAAGIDKLSAPNGAAVGFTNEVSLGFYGRLKKSAVRVMRIKLLPAPRNDQPGELYVRGAAFDLFDGRRWTRAPLGRSWAARRGERSLLPASPGGRGHAIYDFTIYPMNLSVLFTIGTPWLIEGAGDRISIDHADSLHFSSAYQGGAHYKVYPSPDGGFNAGLPGPSFLQAPEDPSGRMETLARQITAAAADSLAKIQAIESHFQKRYEYSLYSDGKNATLEDFLFKTRRGNCEYFATAGVVLLRHAGVPARLVTGFLAADWNEFGKFYDVRQGEAHAWVEAYVPGRGWLRLDPTPHQSLLSVGVEALGRKFQHWTASLETEWYRHVIGYDQYVQRDAFRRIGAALSPAALRKTLRAAGAAAACAAALFLLLGVLRRLSQALTAPPQSAFARAQAALARAGFARQPHWTAREFAGAVAARRPDLAALGGLAELHYLERFCPRGLTAEQSVRAAELLAELKAHLAGRKAKP